MNGGEDVLCPMFGFSGHGRDLPFAPLALGDVLKAIDRTDDLAAVILKWVDIDQHDGSLAATAFDHDLSILHGIAGSKDLGHRALRMLNEAALEMVHAI